MMGLLFALAATSPVRAETKKQSPYPDGSVASVVISDRVGAIPAVEWMPPQGVGPPGLSPAPDQQTIPPQQRYLPYILIVTAAILIQGLLFSRLLHERGQRRRSEAEAHETMAQLTHLSRIATAGELSASIAHELTQPITGMVASANAALRWLSAPTPQIDKARSALAQVVSAGDRTKEIIHSVRAMFKSEAQERCAVDMNEVVAGVLDLLRRDLDRHEVVVERDLGGSPIPVLGDFAQLQQVVLNIAINAIESMQAIEARPRTLHVRTEYREREVSISIEDAGVGISKAAASEIFKPLYTTKSQGMGVGLSICRSIVETHNGRIWVSPGDACGAAFHFVLPTS